MSCYKEQEHRYEGRHDARVGWYDREQYNRYGDDCQVAYTEAYDREQRELRNAQEEERLQNEIDERMEFELQMQRQIEAEQYMLEQEEIGYYQSLQEDCEIEEQEDYTHDNSNYYTPF